MNQHITNFPPVRVAYFRNVGPYGVAMSAVWDRLYQWGKELSIWTPTVIRYGISQDSPMDTPADQCRYDACVEIPAHFAVTGGPECAELPGGEYAVLAFQGPPTEIGKGFERLFDQIIPQAGKQPDFTRPIFERYTSTTRMKADGSFNCDLCVPVK